VREVQRRLKKIREAKAAYAAFYRKGQYVTPEPPWSADEFADYYQDKFANGLTAPEALPAYVRPATLSAAAEDAERPYTMEEHRAQLKHLKRGKMPGPPRKRGGRRITNEMLQHMHSAHPYLLRCFNEWHATGAIPRAEKRAHLSPVLKPGRDHLEKRSWRPISRCTCVLKLGEKLWAARLLTLVTLTPAQHAYLPKRSTDRLLKRLFTKLEGLKGRDACCFKADVFGAFDRAKYSTLLANFLRKAQPGPRMYNWLRDSLTDRTFTVVLMAGVSSSRPMLGGVPQGGCASPLLWLLVIDDLPVPAGGVLYIYADDAIVVIYADTAAETAKAAAAWVMESGRFLQGQGLEWDRKSIEGFWMRSDHCQYATRWTEIAPQEVGRRDRYGKFYRELEHPLLPTGSSGTADPRRHLDVPFTLVETFKVLGVHLDPHLNFKAHVNYLIEKTAPRVTMHRTQWAASMRASRGGGLGTTISIVRYALPAYGPYLARQFMTKVDVKILHPLARAVGSERITVRIELLRRWTSMPGMDDLTAAALARPVGCEGEDRDTTEGTAGGTALRLRNVPREHTLRMQSLPQPVAAATPGILKRATRAGVQETVEALAKAGSRSAQNLVWLQEEGLEPTVRRIHEGAEGQMKTLLARMLSGTLFREYDVVQPCPECGAPDSLAHALTECEVTAELRERALAISEEAEMTLEQSLRNLLTALEESLRLRFLERRAKKEAGADGRRGHRDL
jgi:hypothetical protein